MNLCILSMQRVENFGSLLQSYSLKRILEQQGHTVSFIDIEPRAEDDKLLDGSVMHFADTPASASLWGKLKKIDKYFFTRLCNKYAGKQQLKKFEKFRQEVLGVCKKSNYDYFDCCIIGSDEVFNGLQNAKWGFTSQLYGDVKQADKVITYAASCGGTILEQMPPKAAQRVQEAFENVSAFSVRDENTKNFTEALTDRTVHMHMDPVVVADFSVELEQAILPADLPQRYCLVYAYPNRINREEDIALIKRFCNTHDLKLVSVGGTQMWIDRHLVLEPFEMLKVFQNAAFVITDTFHGTIFSAKYAKRFAVMTRPSNENKLRDLIRKLNLERHWIKSLNQLESVYEYEHNPEDTEILAKRERIRTEQYLKDNV